MHRPRAEACDRLTAGELRRTVAPDADAGTLPDGEPLALRWGPVRGCWGGRGGRALLLGCPACGRWCRVLHRPPGEGWGCWGCRPVSTASHRRSGARRGRGKPSSWRLDQITAAQARTAALLGLEAWPPPGLPLLWSLRDLQRLAPGPGRPRLSPDRRAALLLRLSALESLRVATVAPLAAAELLALGAELELGERVPQLEAQARGALAATDWAMRRPSGKGATQEKREMYCESACLLQKRVKELVHCESAPFSRKRHPLQNAGTKESECELIGGRLELSSNT